MADLPYVSANKEMQWSVSPRNSVPLSTGAIYHRHVCPPHCGMAPCRGAPVQLSSNTYDLVKRRPADIDYRFDVQLTGDRVLPAEVSQAYGRIRSPAIRIGFRGTMQPLSSWKFNHKAPYVIVV